jgi:hypothetical protein
MGLIDPAPIECHWIQVVTYAAMRADGHVEPPAFSTYIRDEAGSTCGVQVTSLPNLANMIRTLPPQRVSWSAERRKIPVSYGATWSS